MLKAKIFASDIRNSPRVSVWLKNSVRTKSTSIKEREALNKCYRILNLPHDCDQAQLRNAFLSLVKRFHPDSGSKEADATKFQEIDTAYRMLQDKFSKDRWDASKTGGEYGLYYEERQETDERKEFDIKHTAPQHRQYLSFDGVGTGTPLQRQKQHQKYRAAVAIENVYNHRVNKLSGSGEESLLVKDKREAKKIKTRYGMERLVEDLIQESMSRGEFDNLSGKGKPLPQTTDNPYVDFVTHKMNQVLIDNGFVPEWISLQKEIAEEKAKLREDLSIARGQLGCLPLSASEEHKWQETLERLKPATKQLNNKITKFNLVVPLMKKQMLLFKLESEAEKELKEGKTVQELGSDASIKQDSSKRINNVPDNNSSLFSLFSSFFH